MNLQITLDFLLIGRGLLALFWGAALATFLQYHHLGQFLARERTWITVVVGVGVNLLIALGGAWAECALIFALSGIPIVARSLFNEARYEPDLNAYKTKWGMEATIDGLGDIIGHLDKALEMTQLAQAQANVSKALAAAHKAQREITQARYGEPGKKK